MISINELVAALLNNGNRLAGDKEFEARSDGGGTTLRFDPELRRFLDAHARSLGGASLQQVVSMILTGVMNASMNEGPKMQVDRMRFRITELFSRHGIDIPTMDEILDDLGFSVTQDGLVERVDNQLVNKLVEMFDVRREWLLGKDDYITPAWNNRWYHNRTRLITRFIELTAQAVSDITFPMPSDDDLKPRLWLLTEGSFDRNIWEGVEKKNNKDPQHPRVGIVIEIVRKTSKGTIFSTYEGWGDEPWFHHPCQTEFRSIVKLLSENRHEIVSACGDALRIDDHYHFIPSDVLKYAGLSVSKDIFAEMFSRQALTGHEMLFRGRGLGAGWGAYECTTAIKGEAIKEVQKYIDGTLGELSRTRPWVKPQ